MKLRGFLSGLLGGILVSCGNAPETTELSTSDRISSTPSPISSSPTELSSSAAESSSEAALFPQEFCGEPIPKGLERYPFDYYQVELERVKDLSKVRTHICRNAEYSKWFGTRLAVFSSQKKAEQFKKILINKMGNLELIQSIKRWNDIEVSKTSLSQSINIQSAAEFCVLGSKKINYKELSRITKLSDKSMHEIYQLQKNNKKKLDLKVILPTYIPSDLDVTDIKIIDESSVYGERVGNTTYRITYKNSDDERIVLGGYHGAGEGDDSLLDLETVKLNVKPFGKIKVGLAEQEGALDKIAVFIAFDSNNRQIYSFFMKKNNRQEIMETLNSLQCFDIQLD